MKVSKLKLSSDKTEVLLFKLLGNCKFSLVQSRIIAWSGFWSLVRG